MSVSSPLFQEVLFHNWANWASICTSFGWRYRLIARLVAAFSLLIKQKNVNIWWDCVFFWEGKTDSITESHVLVSVWSEDGVKLQSKKKKKKKSPRAPSRVQHCHPAGEVWRFLRDLSSLLQDRDMVLYSGWSVWVGTGTADGRGSTVLNVVTQSLTENKLMVLTLTPFLLLGLFQWKSWLNNHYHDNCGWKKNWQFMGNDPIRAPSHAERFHHHPQIYSNVFQLWAAPPFHQCTALWRGNVYVNSAIFTRSFCHRASVDATQTYTR